MKPTQDQIIDALDKLVTAAKFCDAEFASMHKCAVTNDEEWDLALGHAEEVLDQALTDPCLVCQTPTHVSEMMTVHEEECLDVGWQCFKCWQDKLIKNGDRYGKMPS